MILAKEWMYRLNTSQFAARPCDRRQRWPCYDSGGGCVGIMSDFHEDLNDWACITGDGEAAFRLPFTYRMMTLFLMIVVAAFCTWGVFFKVERWPMVVGYSGAIVCLLLLYSSLPRELYINFQERTYRKVYGFGPLAFHQSGTFSDITGIAIRRKGGGRDLPSLSAIMLFDKSATKGFMPLPPDWHLVSTEAIKEPALRKYAQDLSKQMGVPFDKKAV
jgi:hypothetical protein